MSTPTTTRPPVLRAALVRCDADEAFAAAGALFGTTVQRQRVEDAKRHAEVAEAKADEARKQAAASEHDAAKGKALAAAVKSHGAAAKAAAARPPIPEDLVALASQLFPD